MSTHVADAADTALLIAAARAAENEHPDGFVRDSYAARLAGERGKALMGATAAPQWMAYGIGLRTRFTDELLMAAVDAGAVDVVLALGAGLDTRPWRLELPRALSWIEVDTAAMLEYKAAALADVAPHCRVEQIATDIDDAAARRRLIDQACHGDAGTLLLTEGLLMYLPAATVHSLAAETAAAGFRSWLFGLVSPELSRAAHGNEFESIRSLRANSHLEGAEVLSVAAAKGWTVADRRMTVTDGWNIGQKRVLAMLKEMQERGQSLPPPRTDDVTGVWLFQSRR